MRKINRVGTALVAIALAVGVGGSAAEAAPSVGCGRAGLLFCENFEQAPLGGASSFDWGVDTRRGKLTVVERKSGPSDQGRQALRVRTQDNGRAFIVLDSLSLPSTGLYGRMMLRVDDFPTAPDWAHFTLVEATGPGSSEVVRPVGGQWAPPLSRSYWGIGADGGPTGDWTNWTESAPTVADRWTCVEWKLDPATNGVTTWFDGVTSPDLSVTGSEHGGNDVPFVLPQVDTLKIGWQLYQPNTAPEQFTLWIDDIVLDDARVGC